MKSLLILSAILVATCGLTLFWNSQNVMVELIRFVGPEVALGPENIQSDEDGNVLFTNPGAMAIWVLPVWVLAGFLLAISTALAAVALRRSSTPGNEKQL